MKSEQTIRQLYDDLIEAQTHAPTADVFGSVIGEIAIIEYIMEYENPKFASLHESYRTLRQTALSAKAHTN